MKHFDERVFLWAITSRPEDAKWCSTIFNPKWMDTPEMTPIVEEVYSFVREHGVPPSIPTLHRIFERKDPEVYRLRFKPILESVIERPPDLSEVLYALSQVRDVAVVRSLQDMVTDAKFLEAQAELDGKKLLASVSRWALQFSKGSGEVSMNVREAVEALVTNPTPRTRVPLGIKAVDDWTNGGLRAGQLGIFVSPTGQGKSIFLMNAAFKAAAMDQNAWLITNELPLYMETERLLSRMTGVPVKEIEFDPSLGYRNLQRFWDRGLDQRLWLTYTHDECSTLELEATLERHANIYGFKPNLVCVDYMLRLRPTASGLSRDKEWSWIGEVAKDLSKMAKRHGHVGWTATQVNRTGHQSEEVDLGMLEGSVRHINEADAVIAGRKVRLGANGELEGMEFFDLKARGDKLYYGSKVYEVDYSRMLITDNEVDTGAVVRKNGSGNGEERRSRRDIKPK